jgi:hypothetical protein
VIVEKKLACGWTRGEITSALRDLDMALTENTLETQLIRARKQRDQEEAEERAYLGPQFGGSW